MTSSPATPATSNSHGPQGVPDVGESAGAGAGAGRAVAQVAVFAALIAALGLMGAIPVPGLVPITAQTLGVM
ncbi:MAG: BioY family transporter, partial [Micrococcaceae bacterium]